MPHSQHWALTTMVDHVIRSGATCVMDVGYGYGKWGYLVREALDFVHGRHSRDAWIARIDGIDASPPISPIVDWVYDSTATADATLLIPGIQEYDVVILGDVIEHIEKTRGREFISRLLEGNGCVLVNTPRFFFKQEPILGNEHERHLSLWRAEDFMGLGPADIDVEGATLIAAIRGTGKYPSDATVRASRVVQGIPALRGRGATGAAVKEALRLLQRATR